MQISVEHHAPAVLSQRKRAIAAHASQSQAGRFGEIALLALQGIEPRFLGRSARSPVTMSTELL